MVFHVIRLHVAYIAFFIYLFLVLTAVQIYLLSVLQAHLPFAVVGSLEEVKVGDKTVKARQYPWGVVEGEEEFELSLFPELVS